jgi:D-glycero-D-manno-heptose 1,7-bisphosphate phosphatase
MLKGLAQRKAIILDRDGVVIEYVPEIYRFEDVKLRNNTPQAIRLLNENDFLVVVATNQPMIAKGLLTVFQLEQMHLLIIEKLKPFCAHIDKFYYCPHRSEEGCHCRKPKTGMFEQINVDFEINTSTSWMIGDTWRDVQCGKNFGLKTIGLYGGAGFPYAETQVDPDFLCNDLLEAVKIVIK